MRGRGRKSSYKCEERMLGMVYENERGKGMKGGVNVTGKSFRMFNVRSRRSFRKRYQASDTVQGVEFGG